MQKLTIEEIQEKFPNPRRNAVGEYDENAYCVTGAFISTAWAPKFYRFPFPTTVAHKIAEYRRLNELPEIHEYDLLMGASEVIRQNDLGRFDTAWHLLGDLIS